jgi:CRISPR/Cas system-associated exonuclease Cas4 (RecB family)
MTYQYEDMTTQSAFGGRWYDTPVGSYPSITTVLGGTEAPEKTASLESWRNSLGKEKAAAFTKKAQDHGTNVHLLAERYLKKEPVDALINGKPVPQTDMAAFNALKLKLDKINVIWGQEVALYSPSLEVAGRCDLAGEFKGVPVIVDFKTASRVKGISDIHDYKLQLLFYATAHNEMFGTDIKEGIILMVSAAGFPQEFRIVFNDELREELKTRVKKYWTSVLAKA